MTTLQNIFLYRKKTHKGKFLSLVRLFFVFMALLGVRHCPFSEQSAPPKRVI